MKERGDGRAGGAVTQCHFRLSDADYAFLKRFAQHEGETVGAVLRRAVRAMRASVEGRPPGRLETEPQGSKGGS